MGVTRLCELPLEWSRQNRALGLTALLLLPLFVPVLIFGAGAVVAAEAGLGAQSHLLLLGALLLLALTFAPWVAAAALRLAVDSA